MNACIIEDDADSLQHLKKTIQTACPQIHIAGEAGTIGNAVPLLQQARPQIVFLDIELPDGLGFDLLDRIQPLCFTVIFTTAFNQYAIRAIKYTALDYLLKPVSAGELRIAVEKAVGRSQQQQQLQVAQLLINLQKQAEGLSKIALPVKDGFDFVQIQDITRCEALNKYTVVYTRNGQKYISDTSMKDYETLLPQNLFFRVHHGHLVNLAYVDKFFKEGRGGYILLKDGTMIEVAYRRKDELLQKFGRK